MPPGVVLGEAQALAEDKLGDLGPPEWFTAMAEAADRIPGAAPPGLGARAEFAQLASGLSGSFRNLAAEAGTGRPEALAKRLERIDATCACTRERFQIPGALRGED